MRFINSPKTTFGLDISDLSIKAVEIGKSGEKKYISYFLAWQLLTVVVLSYVIFYSLATFRNQGWGTR